jgi:hypothetical protein
MSMSFLGFLKWIYAYLKHQILNWGSKGVFPDSQAVGCDAQLRLVLKFKKTEPFLENKLSYLT